MISRVMVRGMIKIMASIILITVVVVVATTTVSMARMIVFVVAVMSIVIVVMMVLRTGHSVITISRPLLSILGWRTA